MRSEVHDAGDARKVLPRMQLSAKQGTAKGAHETSQSGKGQDDAQTIDMLEMPERRAGSGRRHPVRLQLVDGSKADTGMDGGGIEVSGRFLEGMGMSAVRTRREGGEEMRKLVIVMVMLGFMTATASASEMHMIVMTQDDTEIEVSVDKADWQTETLDKGINYRSYQTKAKTPTAEIMSYGDVIPLKTVQGKSGDWYCMARIAPPMDGDGGEEE